MNWWNKRGRKASCYIWCKTNTSFKDKNNVTPTDKHGSCSMMIRGCFAVSGSHSYLMAEILRTSVCETSAQPDLVYAARKWPEVQVRVWPWMVQNVSKTTKWRLIDWLRRCRGFNLSEMLKSSLKLLLPILLNLIINQGRVGQNSSTTLKWLVYKCPVLRVRRLSYPLRYLIFIWKLFCFNSVYLDQILKFGLWSET